VLTKLDRYALLVIDDIGYVRKDEAETSVLFELVMHRYERRSLPVTSNQPFSEWENVFSTSAMTVAAVDRLVDHSTIIQINGESYRRRRTCRAGSRRSICRTTIQAIPELMPAVQSLCTSSTTDILAKAKGNRLLKPATPR
jgi:hypothetical protein